MAIESDGFGGDECGSGSDGYLPTPVQSTPRRSLTGPIIVIGGVMAILSGLAALGGGGMVAVFCVDGGLAIAAIGVVELVLSLQDKR